MKQSFLICLLLPLNTGHFSEISYNKYHVIVIHGMNYHGVEIHWVTFHVVPCVRDPWVRDPWYVPISYNFLVYIVVGFHCLLSVSYLFSVCIDFFSFILYVYRNPEFVSLIQFDNRSVLCPVSSCFPSPTSLRGRCVSGVQCPPYTRSDRLTPERI